MKDNKSSPKELFTQLTDAKPNWEINDIATTAHSTQTRTRTQHTHSTHTAHTTYTAHSKHTSQCSERSEAITADGIGWLLMSCAGVHVEHVQPAHSCPTARAAQRHVPPRSRCSHPLRGCAYVYIHGAAALQTRAHRATAHAQKLRRRKHV